MVYAQLRAFHAVAAEGGFSRAAAILNVSQPAVSAQVKALEEAYGLTLFERRGRSVTLTEPGQRLFEITRRMFRLEQEADELLRSVHDLPAQQFRVGSDAPYSGSRLLAVYCQEHLGVQASLIMGTGEDIQKQLLGCQIDVAVLVRVHRDPNLLVMPFATHRIVIIVGRDHPWAARSEISVKDLHGQPTVFREAQFSLTSQVFQQTLSRLGVKPQWMLKVDGRENLREAVAAGVGVGATVDVDASTDLRVKALPVVDPPIAITDYIVCLKHRRNLAAIRSFLNLARRLKKTDSLRATVKAASR